MTNIKFDNFLGETTFADADAQPSLNRPWQTPWSVGDAPCPFCTSPVEQVGQHQAQSGTWNVINNIRRTRSLQLIFLRKEGCGQPWFADPASVAGSMRQVKEAFGLACSYYVCDAAEYWFAVQNGWLAGQSQRKHPHCHLVRPLSALSEVNCFERTKVHLRQHQCRQELMVGEFGGAVALAGGSVTGQCFIVQKDRCTFGFQDTLGALERTIASCMKAFRSNQGLYPEFSFALALQGRQVQYAAFIPVLAMPGISVPMARLEERPIALAWSHQKTAQLLREAWEK